MANIISWAKRNSGKIAFAVSLAASAGSTLWMMHAAPKAQRAVVDAENKKYEKYLANHTPDDPTPYQPLTRVEKIKAAAPDLAGPLFLEVVAIACGVKSYNVQGRVITNLVSTINELQTYSDIVDNVLESNVSKDKYDKIHKEIADREMQNRAPELPKEVSDDGLYTYIEPRSGQAFRATAEILRKGVLDFNEMMMNQDKGTLSELMICWMNNGAKNLTLTPDTDTWFWKAEHEKDWLRINGWDPITNDYGNPVASFHYNREPRKM